MTVAEILRRSGYATALIGKWGLGEAGTSGTPNKKGFDSFFGNLNQTHAHNYYADFLWRNEARFTGNREQATPAGVHGRGLLLHLVK
jgi:arylsulfatase A-like enzyme